MWIKTIKKIAACGTLSLFFLTAGCDNGADGNSLAGGDGADSRYPGWFQAGEYYSAEHFYDVVTLSVSETHLRKASEALGETFNRDISGYAVWEHNNDALFEDGDLYFCLTNGAEEIYFAERKSEPKILLVMEGEPGAESLYDLKPIGRYLSREDFETEFAYPDWIQVDAPYKAKIFGYPSEIEFKKRLIRFNYWHNGKKKALTLDYVPYETTIRPYVDSGGFHRIEIPGASPWFVKLEIFQDMDDMGATPNDSDPNLIVVSDGYDYYPMSTTY